ncbi:restriction endonuclease [Streptomyces chartreusis]|uniref:restriction endonuclease n=1 Tax=Streptomyces chartreusis TaxID=1969 RepID=UPI003809533B
MPGDSLRIGESQWVPSRAYVDSWPLYTRERWQTFLAGYRERAAEYPELVREHPELFTLLGSVELQVVVCLVGEWVFSRPAVRDAITLTELWEDPQLSRWNVARRADQEALVRQVAAVSDDFKLLQTDDYSLKFSLEHALDPASANARYFGREEADHHAATAMRVPQVQKMIDALSGRTIDGVALANLRVQLEEIEQLRGQARGNRFELWIGDLLRAHGCEVERGKPRPGEQVDFFVHKPFRAIIECRWQKDRLQPYALHDLRGKLDRRPAIIAGIYVAMSGFTAACLQDAAQEPNRRTVLLWDEGDVRRLLGGEVHALDLYNEHVSDRMRRYQVDQ